MASFSVFRLAEKKCATCSYWAGGRQIDYAGGFQPRYIKAEAGSADCIVVPNRKMRHIDTCPRWRKWEKID